MSLYSHGIKKSLMLVARGGKNLFLCIGNLKFTQKKGQIRQDAKSLTVYRLVSDGDVTTFSPAVEESGLLLYGSQSRLHPGAGEKARSVTCLPCKHRI